MAYAEPISEVKLRQNRGLYGTSVGPGTIKVTGPIGEEISATTFRTALEFCYTRKADLNDDSIYDILSCAEYLQIESLKMKCGEFLETLLTPQTWLKIYRIADKMNHAWLQNNCVLQLRSYEIEKLAGLQEIAFMRLNQSLRNK